MTTQYGQSAPSNEKGSEMSRTESTNQKRAMPPVELVMPRLSYEQMLAILREGGVPESEARLWVAREARLAGDVSAPPL
jgi:hypothetical protein